MRAIGFGIVLICTLLVPRGALFIGLWVGSGLIVVGLVVTIVKFRHSFWPDRDPDEAN